MKILWLSILITIFSSLLILTPGCKRYIEVDAPFTSFNGENVYTTDATAISALTTLYINMSNKSIYGPAYSITSLSFIGGMLSDELSSSPSSLLSAINLNFYTNSLSSQTATTPPYWTIAYQSIFQINAAIEGLSKSSVLTPSVKKQLLGEAKFMRAFYYFYLVNLYGDVPMVVSTDYNLNSLLERSPEAEVKQQIIADLSESESLLSSNYIGSDGVSTTAEKVRPNKWTAVALLSRAYLCFGNYVNAESKSTELIDSAGLSLASLNNVFLKNNTEAIWQLQPVNTGWNTEDARVFILPASGPTTINYPVFINRRLLSSFEPGDQRKTAWLDSVKVGVDTFYYAHKYKIATLNATVKEYNTVFRLAEQYLIRAEARAQQNKFQQSISDINYIRLLHGGLTNPLAIPTTLSGAMNAIIHERQVELFTEWGHRWFDLKRTNMLDSVMSVVTPLKGGRWEARDKLFPIPLNELIYNPNLSQTPGYN